MDLVWQAWVNASPVWEQMVRHASWHHGLFAMAYLVAACLCFLNAERARAALETHSLWHLAAVLLLLLAVNTVLQADALATLFFRALARLSGWYGERRYLQTTLVLALCLTAWLATHWFGNVIKARAARSRPLMLGLTGLVMIFLLRTVSAHATDAVLNWRALGLSMGRMFEVLGLGLVVHGAWHRLQAR